MQYTSRLVVAAAVVGNCVAGLLSVAAEADRSSNSAKLKVHVLQQAMSLAWFF